MSSKNPVPTMANAPQLKVSNSRPLEPDLLVFSTPAIHHFVGVTKMVPSTSAIPLEIDRLRLAPATIQ